MTRLLLVHGNGGASARFSLILDDLQSAGPGVHLPELPGFSGRPLPPLPPDQWLPFLDALADAVAPWPSDDWVFYGHGIGGSMLLEWAARNWTLPGRTRVVPRRVILHACIGAALERRFFPKLMQPMPLRWLVQRLVALPLLQPVWERKLFRFPHRIPSAVRRRFFQDYDRCAAFPVFFDLITPHWYRQVQGRLEKASFHFLWGALERVVAARFISCWQDDFPNSTVEVIEGWDHFPMLDQPEEFCEKLLLLTQNLER